MLCCTMMSPFVFHPFKCRSWLFGSLAYMHDQPVIVYIHEAQAEGLQVRRQDIFGQTYLRDSR
jgi:hypothetical protein